MLSLQSYLTLCDPMTIACQAPLSMEFSRQEYWSGVLSRGIFTSSALAGGFFTTSTTWDVLLVIAAAAAKSLQSCPTLCDPIDGSLPGSPVPGILQASILEWVAISFSNA